MRKVAGKNAIEVCLCQSVCFGFHLVIPRFPKAMHDWCAILLHVVASAIHTFLIQLFEIYGYSRLLNIGFLLKLFFDELLFIAVNHFALFVKGRFDDYRSHISSCFASFMLSPELFGHLCGCSTADVHSTLSDCSALDFIPCFVLFFESRPLHRYSCIDNQMIMRLCQTSCNVLLLQSCGRFKLLEISSSSSRRLL